jgi:hypothetical protein
MRQKKTTEMIIAEEAVVSKIFVLRNQKIMLDRDLAELYGTKAISLREQVKRNKERFPPNFMFQLTKKEVAFMVSQNAIPSIRHLGGTLPYAFTEHGVLMLSNVLKSEAATKVSIRIIEIFIKLREMLLAHKDILLRLEEMEKKIGKQDKNMKLVFEYLHQFVQQQEKPRKQIGFRKETKQ